MSRERKTSEPMKPKSRILKVAMKPTRRIRNFLATDAEWANMKKKAGKWTRGNTSLWIREASLNHTPNDAELVTVGPEN